MSTETCYATHCIHETISSVTTYQYYWNFHSFQLMSDKINLYDNKQIEILTSWNQTTQELEGFDQV